ncbi:MAG: NUDIX domain-containing protein [Merismopedia sp. SIO2A8]|nr:NUDIX domain-containing protein [Symploca sp. SIO2B6]NET49921.1 NUDIX domain-containing protein [Merismopedia sp. SIO2A8]
MPSSESIPPQVPPIPPIPEVAIAILYQGDRFLLQLRDDIPTIRYPGYWAFFGGHLEPGESPDEAIMRELQEEISYIPPQLARYQSYPDDTVIRHVYHAPLIVGLDALELREGWDMALLSHEDIERGHCYSTIAHQSRPIGPPHQQILLNFIQSLPNASLST